MKTKINLSAVAGVLVGLFAAISLHAEQPPADTDTSVPNIEDTASSTPVEKPTVENKAKSPPKSITNEADRVLLDIRDNLTALVSSTLSSDIPIDILFDVPLDNADAVKRRIDALGAEQQTLSQSIAQVNGRRDNLEAEIPPVVRPPELADKPVQPVAPQAPTEPTAPQTIRPKGKLHPTRPDTWKERHAAWEAYDAQYQKYVAAQGEYEKLRVDHQTALAAHKTALANYQKGEAAFQKAQRERAAQMAQKRSALLLEAKNIQIRIQIVKLRNRYLSALHKWLKDFTAPAQTAFAGLTAQRLPLRAEAETLKQLASLATHVATRSRTLSNRAQAGSITGFQARIDKVYAEAEVFAQAFERRSESLQNAADYLVGLAQKMEKRSARIRRLILLNVTNPKRDTLIDNAFLEELKAMRRSSRSISMGDAANGPKTKSLLTALRNAIPSPHSVGTAEEAMAALEPLKAQLERLDTEIDNSQLLGSSRAQVLRREFVTVLSALATENTRRDAYSLSRELRADVIADLENLKTSVSAWGAEKWETILSIPTLAQTRAGISRIARIFGAVVILLFVSLLRRRLRDVITVAIRRLGALRFFRHRVGALVRAAGLAETILPTVFIGAALYSALFLMGMNTAEVRFVEVAVRWIVVFSLGRKILEGLTRRVSRGRPAFIPVSPKVSELLSITYSRFGLFFAIGGIAHEWSTEWLGAGLLGILVIWIVWTWVCGWGVWALFAWRPVVSQEILHRTTVSAGSSETGWRKMKRTANWMSNHRTGAILTIPAILWLAAHSLNRRLRHLLADGGIFAWFSARSLRRLAKGAQRDSLAPAPASLPERYVREFPMYPIYDEEDVVLLPRQTMVKEVAAQLAKWQSTKQDSSLVLVGEKGIGKTTLLTLIEREISELSPIRYSVSRKLKTEKSLVEELGPALGLPQPSALVGPLAAHLNQGEPRVILLDEVHNVFLRTVDGYDAYEALIRLVNFTSQNVFWVLVFNKFSWAFLNASRRRIHYFRKLMFMPSWTRDELLELISRRNKASGFKVEFDEVLLDASRSVTGDFEVIDGAEGFFRLLWENSLGNPRVATHLWLEALTPVGKNKIRVGLFSESLSDDISAMDRELLFTLAAVCQHENLSIAELSDVLNVPLDFASFAVRFLHENELLEPKHTDARRWTLAPPFYPQVLKLLRQNHLLFEKE